MRIKKDKTVGLRLCGEGQLIECIAKKLPSCKVYPASGTNLRMYVDLTEAEVIALFSQLEDF